MGKMQGAWRNMAEFCNKKSTFTAGAKSLASLLPKVTFTTPPIPRLGVRLLTALSRHLSARNALNPAPINLMTQHIALRRHRAGRRVLLDRRHHHLQLGVQIVGIVHHQCLGRHRRLGRAPFRQPLM